MIKVERQEIKVNKRILMLGIYMTRLKEKKKLFK
jgi:hypothetical protein